MGADLCIITNGRTVPALFADLHSGGCVAACAQFALWSISRSQKLGFIIGKSMLCREPAPGHPKRCFSSALGGEPCAALPHHILYGRVETPE